MRERFGSIDDAGPTKYLEDAGYREYKFRWHAKDGVKCLRDMTRDEFECLLFLVHEWDYDGLYVWEPGEAIWYEKPARKLT